MRCGIPPPDIPFKRELFEDQSVLGPPKADEKAKPAAAPAPAAEKAPELHGGSIPAPAEKDS